jgi:anti-sigma factor RsiW
MMAEHPHEHNHECRRLLASLSDYVDGLLDDALCREIEAHMAGCDDCRIVVNTLAKTVDLYRADPAPDLPAEVAQRLYSSLNLDDFLRQPAPVEDEPSR